MIPTSPTYRDRLHPWCVIRHLPNLQSSIVARFRCRNDAIAHLQLLQQLIPAASLAVIFETNVNDRDEES
ncbi:hypothetical protein H6F74_22580 [Trichocoleus sp. FACHB-90]|uniref:hypothetical protein n=1 Tax=Cyanophyceae TaxID=3028117 RepID=UPI00168868B8|nr:hypothetical protein [Trichocoleus sp. FACHB-90]MBD1929010.1 hypothetical protein [Trichocoleus sp. FACHB-90]